MIVRENCYENTELIVLLSSNIQWKRKPIMFLYLEERLYKGCEVRCKWAPAASSSSLEVLETCSVPGFAHPSKEGDWWREDRLGVTCRDLGTAGAWLSPALARRCPVSFVKLLVLAGTRQAAPGPAHAGGLFAWHEVSPCPRQPTDGGNIAWLVRLRADKGKIVVSCRSGFPGGISAMYNSIIRNISSAASSMSKGRQPIRLCPLLCLATARKPRCRSSLALSMSPCSMDMPHLVNLAGTAFPELQEVAEGGPSAFPAHAVVADPKESLWSSSLSSTAWHGDTRATHV